MRTCKKCGVQVEDNVEECPLCGEPVTEERRKQRASASEGENVLKPGTEMETGDSSTLRSAKIWAFEMVSLVAFTAAIIIAAADFAFDFSLSWSLIPLAAIGFIYLAVSAIVALFRYPAALLIAETVAVAGFLLLLDLLLPQTDWFLRLALPITVLVALFSGIAGTTIVKLKLNALQAVAVWFLAAGFFVVGLEFVLNWALRDELLVSWSLIAFACTLSLFFLILFINKRLRERHAEFRRIFHI